MGKRSKNSAANSEIIESKTTKTAKETETEEKVCKAESIEKSKKRKTTNKSINNKIKKSKDIVLNEDVLNDTSASKGEKHNIGKSKRGENLEKKKDKNKKIIFEEDSGEPIREPKTTGANNSEKKKNDKNKKIIFEEDSGEPIKETKTTSANISGKKKNDKNKKIIFEEDTGEPMEVSTSGNQKKVRPNEEEVKDEDIDKFCDEITEEDNAQFENWVQLIEAKLKSTKNKSKIKT